MVLVACVSDEQLDDIATITGRLVSRPTCPVETNPPDPDCAPQAVPDALIVVTLADGTEITALSEQDGRFRISLPPGTFSISFAPVEGIMSPPEPITGSVQESQQLHLYDLSYDTGIR
jgi:hypothetical protein